jgi:hypothetical protein
MGNVSPMIHSNSFKELKTPNSSGLSCRRYVALPPNGGYSVAFSHHPLGMIFKRGLRMRDISSIHS